MLPDIRRVETDDGAIRYAQAGYGVDVVLVHGAMSSLEEMALGPFDRLASAFRVTAVDRPGHGASPRPRLRGGLAAQSERLRQAFHRLGLDRPVLVGQSFGGALALHYALTWPDEIRGVVAISPLVFPELRMEHLLFGLRAIVGPGDVIAYGPGRLFDVVAAPLLWQAMFLPQPVPDRVQAHFPLRLATGVSQMLALGEEAVLSMPDLAASAARYAGCKTPAEILVGTADMIVAPALHGELLASLMPDARLTRLPALGHMLHHFAPEAVYDAVRRVASDPSRAAPPRGTRVADRRSRQLDARPD